MKLWQKAFLICAAVLTAAVSACSAALIIHFKNNLLETARSQIREKQHMLAVSFSETVNSHVRNDDSPAVRKALANYCFAKYADYSCVLMLDGDILYSGVMVDPSEYLIPEENFHADIPVKEIRYNGLNVLIAGSTVSVINDAYHVYVVEDISPVYDSIADMAVLLIAVSAAAIILGSAAAALLMRLSTRPVSELAATARRIAGGEYKMRTEKRSNDEIGLLAEDFNRMADAVETHIATLTDTAERQRLFIGGVTHEFKTPLTSMLLHTQLLQRSYMTEDERLRSLEHIETQCLWLERLVQTLLKMITLGGDVEKRPTDARELCRMAEERLTQPFKDRGVRLNISCTPEKILLNPELALSLIINLADNAANSYDIQDVGKEVFLRISNNTVEVRDNGRGIPKGMEERIFEPFCTIDKSRSKQYGGSGLGLALVKSIADAHGADISVKSELGKGTAVRVVFPSSE